MSSNHRLTLLAVLLLGASSLSAQAPPAPVPGIQLEPAPCFPRGDNGVANAVISPEVGGTTNRLYFRWHQDEDFYWVAMHGEGGGRYWGIPAKADSKNEAIEYYVAVVDPANRVLAKSAPLMSPVEDDCKVDLTERQRGEAQNLTIGETTFEQVGEEVDGFLCDGVVSRINPNGVLRGDERCRACVIAWWDKPAILIPAAAGAIVGGVLISRHSPPEASPATPVKR